MQNNLFIHWKEELHATGIPIIDEQHRVLVGLINSFYNHKTDQDIDRILVPTAMMTLSFAKIHFITEEEVMREAQFPGLEEHMAEHRTLYKNLVRTELKCRAVRDTDTFLEFLKDWWVNHANGYDRGYVEHVRKQSK